MEELQRRTAELEVGLKNTNIDDDIIISLQKLLNETRVQLEAEKKEKEKLKVRLSTCSLIFGLEIGFTCNRSNE